MRALAAVLLVVRAARGADDAAAAPEAPACDLTPFPTAAFPAVDALLKKHLKPKHAAQFAALMQEPCESFNVGVILNLVQMRNTNAAFAAFTTAALAELDAPSVAGVWARTPRRAQVWLLKSFVAALPCTVRRRATRCEEASTNDLMEKFTVAREAYADAALERRGLAPFPAEKEDVESGSDADIAEYAARLGVEGDAAAWLVEQFAPSAADKLANPNVTLVEPAWWKLVQASCRQQANLQAPGSRLADDAANLTDLSLVVAANLWKWHYKTCHKNAALFAYERKDAAEPADGAAKKDEL
mmetsp:Transcript_21003/g.64613  ORF Transcript_21003/g.64613 Transcript_21003/m.64613 type:complete len:300 (-) Transcript_21003:21-920(-)